MISVVLVITESQTLCMLGCDFCEFMLRNAWCIVPTLHGCQPVSMMCMVQPVVFSFLCGNLTFAILARISTKEQCKKLMGCDVCTRAGRHRRCRARRRATRRGCGSRRSACLRRLCARARSSRPNAATTPLSRSCRPLTSSRCALEHLLYFSH